MRKPVAAALALTLVLLVGLLIWLERAKPYGGGRDYATNITLTGTTGTLFTGYYVLDGRRVEVSDAIPWSFSASNISACEFHKTDTNATFHLEARGEASMLSIPVGAGASGVRAKLEGGWNLESLR